MSGHSKWATIKHKKGIADAKRGKLFSKLVKEITVAARLGGDVQMNPKLRLAVNSAKNASMPSKNIENAIKKGTGAGKDDVMYFELSYEGYGPSGVAIIVECLTDNKNRTIASVRATFSKHGGRLGENGSVAWQFEKKGVINIERDQIEEELLMELAIEVGADDVSSQKEGYTVYTNPEYFHSLYESLKEKSLEFADADILWVPKNLVSVNDEENEKVARLVNHLDDLEDVKSVCSNQVTG